MMTKLAPHKYVILDETGESLTSAIGANNDDHARQIAREMYGPKVASKGYKLQRKEGGDALGRGAHYVDVAW